MPDGLTFEWAPERLDDAPPEERVCFGHLTIETPSVSLTSGVDSFIESVRTGPLVSGYHVAEWLAWNWWRLRYEPRSPAADWWRAHKMNAIGEGYVWPNLTIYSDGARTILLSDPSSNPDAKPFRYLGATPTVMPSREFEAAVDSFISKMEGRLFANGITDTPLSQIWAEVRDERASPTETERRRLEALMGRDPDQADNSAVTGLIKDARILGKQSVEELAAEAGRGGALLDHEALRELARGGVSADTRDSVSLDLSELSALWGEVPAHVVGERAAKRLRAALGLGDEWIEDAKLARMVGLSAASFSQPGSSPLSFALDQDSGRSVLLFRSRHPIARRFDLARLIAERVVQPIHGALHAVTRAYTYRQKMQRSFAAEFLSPFDAVEAHLEGDYGEDAQAEVAYYFQVSERTILAQLVNHGRLPRETLEAFDAAA